MRSEWDTGRGSKGKTDSRKQKGVPGRKRWDSLEETGRTPR